MTSSSRIRSWAAPALLAPVLLLASATAAQASCAPAPPVSAHVFVGTVTSLADQGRTAQVRTADGQAVEVDGSPTRSGVTSVDRTYVLGATYEFHPVNAATPYQDNVCTATHALTQGPTGPERTATASHASRSDGPSPWWAAGASLPAAAGLLLWRRRARLRHG